MLRLLSSEEIFLQCGDFQIGHTATTFKFLRVIVELDYWKRILKFFLNIFLNSFFLGYVFLVFKKAVVGLIKDKMETFKKYNIYSLVAVKFS